MRSYLVLFFLLCGPANAVDVSEVAKAVKREFGTGDCAQANKMRVGECREWVLILGALQKRTDVCLVDQASVMRDAERQRYIISEARKKALGLKKEKLNMLQLLK